MLLDTHKISLIYDFWKLNNEETYLHEINELSRKLNESNTIDAEYIHHWIPDLIRLVELWNQQNLNELNRFYTELLIDHSSSDKIDALLHFLYDIQTYELVQYLLEANVEHYKRHKLVSSTMNVFHESCIYGFSQVCLLYLRNSEQDLNETFSLKYENLKTDRKEIIHNLTALQLVCLWSKYFPQRLSSYAHTLRILLNHGARVNMTSTELTTPLHWTCQTKHTTQLARDLIEHGAYVNARDKLNIQPIHYACWARNQTLVELLLAKGAQLTDRDDSGRTPVHFLCMPTYTDALTTDDQHEQYKLMDYLLSNHSIDLTKQDNHGYTLLAYACVSRNLSLMQLLLQHESEFLNKTTNDGRTPLMIAIDQGFLNGVEYLLQQVGLERNTGDIDGNTAVHHACMSMNTSSRLILLRMLIDDSNGIFNLEKQNEQLIDPLMLCTINQSIDLCRLLVEKNVLLTKRDIYSRQSLHIACQMGNCDLVTLMISSPHIDLNEVDGNDRNCLFYAISSGNEKVVDLLIGNNINIAVRDIVGDTPLHSAVQHQTNAYALTHSLFQRQEGKDLINESASDGMKPILLAANCAQAEVIYLLLQNNANVKVVDKDQHTALHLACQRGCMKSVTYLVEIGDLDINELDVYHQTALFYAFASNNYNLVQYLISRGAQIDVRDDRNYLPLHIGILSSNNDQEYDLNLIDLYQDEHVNLFDDQTNECRMTPLMLACMQGKFNVVKHLILNYPINIMQRCSNGHTALHYACLLKHSRSVEIIEFLIEHGCTYEKVDQPKGTFLFTTIQYGDRQATMFFLDAWLKTNPDINDLHYGATVLDLLYNRAQIHHHDIDSEYLQNLLEKGARFNSTEFSTGPCLLSNDCPTFYLMLLKYNCSAIADRDFFLFQLVKAISTHPDHCLLLNTKENEYITVCDYLLRVLHFAYYDYHIQQFFSTIDQSYFPQLHAQQPNEDVETLRKQFDYLRTTPLKLSEIGRKLLRQEVAVPTRAKFQQLGLNKHLVEFLVQDAFSKQKSV